MPVATVEEIDFITEPCLWVADNIGATWTDIINQTAAKIRQIKVYLSTWATVLQTVKALQNEIFRTIKDMNENLQNGNAALQHARQYFQQVSEK